MTGLAAYATIFAIMCTKATDMVRNLVGSFVPDAKQPPWLKVVWVVLPAGIGIAISLAFNLDALAAVGADTSHGTAAQVVTGLVIGAAGSGWHELFDVLSQSAKKSSADADQVTASMSDT
jgi:hypothetical protein